MNAVPAGRAPRVRRAGVTAALARLRELMLREMGGPVLGHGI